MNLDHEGGGDWFDARHYAKLQTQHEWCRLLHLSRQLDPTFRAAGRLLGTWVKAGPDVGLDTPHIPGTACARGVAKRHLVEISATLTMGAPRTSSFVVFRGDFTSSARTTMGPNSTKTLKICGNTNDSIVADLNEIVTKIWPPSGPARVPAQGPKIVVQVPSTARAWSIRDNTASFEATFDIKVTPNVC